MSRDSSRSRLSSAGGFGAGVDSRVESTDVTAVLKESAEVDTINDTAKTSSAQTWRMKEQVRSHRPVAVLARVHHFPRALLILLVLLIRPNVKQSPVPALLKIAHIPVLILPARNPRRHALVDAVLDPLAVFALLLLFAL